LKEEIMSEETKPVCPKCGCSGELVIELGHGRHCNACGHDFDLVKNPVPRASRSEKSGYHEHKHGR